MMTSLHIMIDKEGANIERHAAAEELDSITGEKDGQELTSNIEISQSDNTPERSGNNNSAFLYPYNMLSDSLW